MKTKQKETDNSNWAVRFLLFRLYVCSAIPGFPVLYEHHVCLSLFVRESFTHQPRAEHVRAVGVQSESDGDDNLKRVNIRIQTVFKLNVATYLVVVQHVRFEDGFDGGVHCRDTCVEQSGDFSGGHPYIVTGYADRLVLYDDYVTFHGFSFLDGATCKFLNTVQPCGKVLHVLIEFFFGYLRVNLRRLYALVSEHGADGFDRYAIREKYRRVLINILLICFLTVFSLMLRFLAISKLLNPLDN